MERYDQTALIEQRAAHSTAAWLAFPIRGESMKIYVSNVFVDDQTSALAFYTEKLGFEMEEDIPLGEHRYLTVVEKGGGGTEVLLEPSDHPAVAPFKDALRTGGIPYASFQVDDLDAEFTRLTGLGVEFTQALMDAGEVKMAVLDDTCGNLVQLVEILTEA